MVFLHAAWEFDILPNLSRKSQSQKESKSMTLLQYLLNFTPTLGKFLMDI